MTKNDTIKDKKVCACIYKKGRYIIITKTLLVISLAFGEGVDLPLT